MPQFTDPQKTEILEQAGKSLSFIRALSFALKLNQWTTNDREFLSQHITSLHEQLSSLSGKLLNNIALLGMEQGVLEENNGYKKAALISVADAIAALHSSNPNKLEFALNITIGELESLVSKLKKTFILIVEKAACSTNE